MPDRFLLSPTYATYSWAASMNTVVRNYNNYVIASERIHTDETFPDLTDIVFYEVALSKEDSFLVTGNIKHFPKNPIVVTPSEFLKLIEKL